MRSIKYMAPTCPFVIIPQSMLNALVRSFLLQVGLLCASPTGASLSLCSKHTIESLRLELRPRPTAGSPKAKGSSFQKQQSQSLPPRQERQNIGRKQLFKRTRRFHKAPHPKDQDCIKEAHAHQRNTTAVQTKTL